MGGTLSGPKRPSKASQVGRLVERECVRGYSTLFCFDPRHVGAVSNYALGSGGVYFYVLYGIIIDYNCTLLTLTRCAGQTGEIRFALLQRGCVCTISHARVRH